jgi:hypothetical protein
MINSVGRSEPKTISITTKMSSSVSEWRIRARAEEEVDAVRDDKPDESNSIEEVETGYVVVLTTGGCESR